MLFAFSEEYGSAASRVASGNPCTVSLLPQLPQTAPLDLDHTQCVSSVLEDGSVDVRCWTATGSPIALCGHGLLCSGVAWMRAGQLHNQLLMNGVPILFETEDDVAWIGMPPIATAPCAVPAWTREFFPSLPWRAAQAGGASGYLILEWPSGYDLRSLPVPDYGLRRRTQQAIIATSVDTQHPDIDVQLRYFAPQHGVPEDTATGSAMRVLATYWMNRELADGLRAFQCSPDGGVLRSRMRAELTWIGGRVIPGGDNES